jgi:hypothetical protein
LDGAVVGAGSLKPIKATSSVKSSALKLNLLWDDRHPCHITKMKKKHCCSLITSLANDYHCHNQVVGSRSRPRSQVGICTLKHKNPENHEISDVCDKPGRCFIVIPNYSQISVVCILYPMGPSVPARQPFFNWKNFTKKQKLKIKNMRVK